MRTHHIILIIFVNFTFGCESRVDLDTEREALRETDLKWAAAASAGTDVDRVVAFWSDDAKVYPPGLAIAEGKAAIREFVSGGFDTPGFAVTWEPQEVVVSEDGRNGYTTGTNRFTVPDVDGNVITTVNRYVTIWRKEADGHWKCVIDIWNAAPIS